MIALPENDVSNSLSPDADDYRAAISWLASHNRQVANGHMALAEKAEHMMTHYLNDRRSRLNLRTFARHNRRAAWQHLEMAIRAEAMLRHSHTVFDLGDAIASS
jgi:hypothetical protein